MKIRNRIGAMVLVAILSGCGKEHTPVPSGKVLPGFQVNRQMGDSQYTSLHLHDYQDATGRTYEKVVLVDMGNDGTLDKISFMPGPMYQGERAKEWQSLYDGTLQQLVK